MGIEVADCIAEASRAAIGVSCFELGNEADAGQQTDRNFRLLIWLDEGFLKTDIDKNVVRVGDSCVLLAFLSRILRCRSQKLSNDLLGVCAGLVLVLDFVLVL